jgi:hypothetical protein
LVIEGFLVVGSAWKKAFEAVNVVRHEHCSFEIERERRVRAKSMAAEELTAGQNES